MSEPGLLAAVPWETRNLGRESFVLCAAAQEPDGERLVAELAALRARYNQIFVQARIAKEEYRWLPILAATGFHTMETLLHPYTQLRKNAALTSFQQHPASFLPGKLVESELTFRRVAKSADEERAVIRAIAAESFSDDRFHLDPCCSEAQANRRFACWIDDLWANAAVTFDLLGHRAVPVGFMARRAEELILAGFAKSHVRSGLGEYLWLSVLQAMLAEGHTQVRTAISANNTVVMNLYARLGFKFRDPAMTLHLWGG